MKKTKLIHREYKPAILIIDDEPKVLTSLSRLLNDDYRVYTASNGKEGLSILNDVRVSLIILDLNMPEMNGVQFLQALRKAHGSVPVIVVTGSSCHDWAMECADLYVQGYIEKPFDAEVIFKRIKKLLPVERFDTLQAIWGENYDSKMSSLSSYVKRALKYIQENYSKELTREDVAFFLDISPSYLSRIFLLECGIYLKDYINILRVCKCKECLMDFDKKVGEIGPEIGIPNINYMIRLFKKHTGLTPREFRKKHLKI